MVQLIPNLWKKIWDKWNVRGVILFSLCLQIFLILSASSRKRTKSLVLSFVWLAYLLADWAASFCVGLISNNQDSNSTFTRNNYLMAFWAPFLLLHLGGPDTITAFALEDNELWLRHLLGLIFQAVAAAYVFFLTIPQNSLWLPTLLMFLAGLIKYIERTCALYHASIDNFRQSLVPDPDPGPNYAKLMEEHSSRKQAGLPAQITITPELGQRSDEVVLEENHGEIINELEEVQKAYCFFQRFKGLIVDMIYSLRDRRKSRQYFKNKMPEDTLRVIEIELNFMYEAFYTKASIVRCWLGYSCKFVSFISTGAALGLFISADKKGFNKFDVRVTYALLCGALALDTMAFFMLIFTDYTATLSVESQNDSYKASQSRRLRIRFFKCFNENILVHFLKLRRPMWKHLKNGPYKDCHQMHTSFVFRRWSESISGHNLVDYCVQKSVSQVPDLHRHFHIARVISEIVPSGRAAVSKVVNLLRIRDLLDQWKYEARNPFLKELWVLIFQQLKKKSGDDEDVETIQSKCSDTGVWALRENSEGLKQKPLENLQTYVEPGEVAFDESLLLWHIATTLCYFRDDSESKERKISKILSDYMLYLLVMQPTMMSAVAGNGQIRFQDTCAEAQKFLSTRNVEQRDRLKKACQLLYEVPTELKPIDVKGDRSKSVLFDACRLAKELDGLRNDDKKWKIMSSVWVELLSYAASHCRPTGHVQLVSKGGELISFVWLLMVHLGLSAQFQIQEGHARAKLLVGK